MTLIDKTAARKSAFARRKIAHDAGVGTAAHLSEVLAGYRGVPIAGYMPMRTEIDPIPAMTESAAHGAVCVPVIVEENAPLRFRQWEPDCALETGAFGAQIPVSGDWIEPEIVIVPMVGFSRSGGRLGYGGGFYDRTLELLRSKRATLAIGFAYSVQEDPDLPIEPWDQPLDIIVTEAGIIDVSR